MSKHAAAKVKPMLSLVDEMSSGPEPKYEVGYGLSGLPWWAQLVMNPPAMQETWVRFLGWEDSLKKGKATHSSILAWRIPWSENSIVHRVAKSPTYT